MRRLRQALTTLTLSISLPLFAQTPIGDAGPNTALDKRLDKDLQQLHYEDLEHDLANAPPGLTTDFFTGILDDRTSRFDDSIRLLTPLLSAPDTPRPRIALILGALADDNVKLFHYGEAHRLYDQLLPSYADVMSPELVKDDQDDNATLATLTNTPAQTITLNGIVDIPTHTDPLGSHTADLTLNGITTPWILDTGANISCMSESLAKQLGLTLSTSTAQTMGATGAENTLHTAILPELNIGSATLHNVVLLVLPDANLTLSLGKKKSYVIPAILGYPVFQSLGIIRFTHDHRFLAGPSLPLTGDSSPIFFDKLSPLFSVRTHNVARVFLFDSGANASQLSTPYYQEFQLELAHQKQGKSRASGAGGISTSRVYIIDTVPLQFGGRTDTLQHIAAHSNPITLLSDHYEGSLGRDSFANFESITLDFLHDRVYLGAPLPTTESK